MAYGREFLERPAVGLGFPVGAIRVPPSIVRFLLGRRRMNEEDVRRYRILSRGEVRK